MSSKDFNDEEFNNFMHKVTEVSNIVGKLSSSDVELQKIGSLEADRFLGGPSVALSDVNEDQVKIKVKTNRSLINKNALKDDDKKNADGTMSQEAFMAEVSKDAERRYQDKLVRKERMETFKKQATLAFRRGEFEKALSLYTKAIEQIKDNALLYNNRALTYINLKFYDKAVEDINWALRLNEDCIKSWMLLAKAHYLNGNHKEFEVAINEAKERNPQHDFFINGEKIEYVDELKKFSK